MNKCTFPGLLLLVAILFFCTPITASASISLHDLSSTEKTVKRVVASENSLRLLPLESKQILLHATYSDGTIEEVAAKAEWSSTSRNVADVQKGLITSNRIGSTTIVATYGGKVDTITVDVFPEKKVKRLKMSATTLKLLPGEKKQVTLHATYQDDTTEDISSKASWSSTKSNIARAYKGQITGDSLGSTVIVAIYSGKSKTLKVEVVAEKKVTKLKANHTSLQMRVGETKQIVLQATYEDGSTGDIVSKAEWTTSKEDVTNVSTGLITAKKSGTSKIYATYGGKKATISVHVK